MDEGNSTLINMQSDASVFDRSATLAIDIASAVHTIERTITVVVQKSSVDHDDSTSLGTINYMI